MERREQAEKLLRKFIREEDLDAFPVVVVEQDMSEAVKAMLQSHGIGGIRPNAVLLGWSQDPKKREDFCETLRLAEDFRRSIVVVKCDDERERWDPPEGSVDVWWQGRRHGSLSLLLAHLLKQNPVWRHRPLRVLSTLPPKADEENLSRELVEMLEASRIDAEIHVFLTDDPVFEIAKQTGESAVLFTEFTPPEEVEEAEFLNEMERLMGIPIDMIFVHNSGDVELEA